MTVQTPVVLGFFIKVIRIRVQNLMRISAIYPFWRSGCQGLFSAQSAWASVFQQFLSYLDGYICSTINYVDSGASYYFIFIRVCKNVSQLDERRLRYDFQFRNDREVLMYQRQLSLFTSQCQRRKAIGAWNLSSIDLGIEGRIWVIGIKGIQIQNRLDGLNLDDLKLVRSSTR